MRLLIAGALALLYLFLLYAGVAIGLIAIVAGIVMIVRAKTLDAQPVEGQVSARSEGGCLIVFGAVLAGIAGALDYWHFFSG